MKFLKELVLRKHNEFFIQLKNNRFNPVLFFEAVSLANSYLNRLSEKDMKLRSLLLELYQWEILKRSLRGVKAELKGEFNVMVKSNYSNKVVPILNELYDCMKEDELLLSEFYTKFKVEKKIELKRIAHPDIKQRWSVGIVKNV